MNEYTYTVLTSNRFEILDNLEVEVNSQYVSEKPMINRAIKNRVTRSRNNKLNENAPNQQCSDRSKYANSSLLQRRNNHIAACKRLEDKISSMPFEDLIDYCTSRVLTKTVKNLVKNHHPYLFDVHWIHDSKSPGAYLAYICASNYQLSKADALGYCLDLNRETSEAVNVIYEKFSTGWLRDLTRDGDVEPNPGPMSHQRSRIYTR